MPIYDTDTTPYWPPPMEVIAMPTHPVCALHPDPTYSLPPTLGDWGFKKETSITKTETGYSIRLFRDHRPDSYYTDANTMAPGTIGARPLSTTVYVEADKVTVDYIQRIIFMRNGEIWVRHRRDKKIVFSFRNGTFNIYNLFKLAKSSKWQIRNVTLSFSGFNMGAEDELIITREVSRMAERFGYDPIKPYCLAQAAKQMTVPLHRDLVLPRNLKKPGIWRKATTIRDVIEHYYGTYTKAHYRDFVRVLLADRDKEPDYDWAPILDADFLALEILKGLVPHEWLDGLPYNITNSLTSNTGRDFGAKEVRSFVKQFTPKKMVDFVKLLDVDGHTDDTIRREATEAKDAMAMWAEMTPDRRPTLPHRQFTWGEIHTIIAIEYIKGQHPNEPIEQTELAKAIDGMQVGRFTLVTPKETDTVHAWGAAQMHCIGTYARQAVTGNNVLFGVYEGARLHANGQIHCQSKRVEVYDENTGAEVEKLVSYHVLNQMLGKHNTNLSQEDFDMITEALVTVGVEDLFDGVWGNPAERRHEPPPIGEAPVIVHDYAIDDEEPF